MAIAAVKPDDMVWVDEGAIDPAQWFVLSPQVGPAPAADEPAWTIAGAASARFATAAFAAPLVTVSAAAPASRPASIPQDVIHRLPRRAPGVHRLPQRRVARPRSGGRREAASRPASRRTEIQMRRRAFAVLIAAVVGIWGSLVVSTGGIKSQTRMQTLAQPGDTGVIPR